MPRKPTRPWEYLMPHVCKYCTQKFFHNTYQYISHLRRHELWIRKYWYNYKEKMISEPRRKEKKETHHMAEFVAFYSGKKSTLTDASLNSTSSNNYKGHDEEMEYQYCKKGSQVWREMDNNQQTYSKQHSKSFSNEQTNIKEKPYRCQYCHKGFKYFSSLKYHQRIHTKEKPHKCQYCNKGFVRLSHLKSHERIHTKEKPYKCQYCNKGFNWRGDLKRHERIHTKEKPYKCQYCNKGFAQSGNMKTHERIHIKEQRSSHTNANTATKASLS